VWLLARPIRSGFLRRLASFGRTIIFERRGTGMPDPVAPQDLPDLETQVDDVLAVLDTTGPEKAIVVGIGPSPSPRVGRREYEQFRTERDP
jgi:pimeloyl-ACP methyl ester carboxylesterase